MLPAVLSPIEDYFFLDDNADYPMVVWYRMEIRGQLDHAALADAFHKTSARHPMLTATVDDQSKRHPHWLANPKSSLEIQYEQPLNESGFPEARPMDLRTEPGTRVFLNDFGERHQIALQVHHCCSDAIGIQHFLSDVLCEYAKRGEGCPLVNVIRKLDPRRFPKRSTPQVPRWRYTLGLHRTLGRCRDVVRILFSSPAQLCRSSVLPVDNRLTTREQQDTQSPAAEGFGISVSEHEFDREETSRILQTARDASVSVNSLILSHLFQTVLNWRTEHGIHESNDKMRICVPVNLRTEKDRALTATNSLSLLFVDRIASEVRNTKQLIKSVEAEIRNGRRDMWLTFIATLSVARMLPGQVVERFTEKNQAWSTCLFSNVGVAFSELSSHFEDGKIDLGGANVESWSFLPPLRRYLGLSVGCSTCAGRLKLACHFDPELVTREAMQSILKTWTNSVLEYVPEQKSESRPGAGSADGADGADSIQKMSA